MTDLLPGFLFGFAAIPRGQYLVAIFSLILVTCCVLLHYEVLRKLSDWLSRMRRFHRVRVLVLIVGLLSTHVIEIGPSRSALGCSMAWPISE